MYKQLVLIFLGGGLGSVLRFWVSQYASKIWLVGQFPFGTFVVNILGCFLVGFLSNFITKDIFRSLFIIGFCGGFTTFSTFSLEGLQFCQSGNYTFFFVYILISVIVGITLVWLGSLLWNCF